MEESRLTISPARRGGGLGPKESPCGFGHHQRTIVFQGGYQTPGDGREDVPRDALCRFRAEKV